MVDDDDEALLLEVGLPDELPLWLPLEEGDAVQDGEPLVLPLDELELVELDEPELDPLELGLAVAEALLLCDAVTVADAVDETVRETVLVALME